MQKTYWNGTYWPTTIQWIGAFIDTLLIASERSLTGALEEYDGNVQGAKTGGSSINADILSYYSEVEAYYGDEDVVQIFGAAYDDAQWVVLEWLEAIRFINKYDSHAKSTLGQSDIARFAHRAHIFYNIVQNQFDTSLCGGGITWNPALAPYKNAITNELFLASSIGMYLYYPGDDNSNPYPSPSYTNATNATLPALPTLAAHDPLLLSNAQKEYQWFKTQNFTNAQGLVVDGFHVSDNQTTCDERNEMVYTYNQGVILSGLRGLWEATGDAMYLSDGYVLVSTVINATGWNAHSPLEAGVWAGLGRNGIMEDYCDAPANCTQDAQAFKGIYFHHLDLFCEPLPTTKPLVAGVTKLAPSSLANQHTSNCAGYLSWIEHNANAALSTRNSSGMIGGWWGASYVNRTQAPSLDHAVPPPWGSDDEWNQPWLLQQSPWACRGQHGCQPNGRGSHSGNSKRMARPFRSRKRQDANAEGRGRTVETEASGLSVVKAASDFSVNREAT
ncbi:glycoside hydrolase family 76 protein [Baudoinia panamericana UAMH 10762]|uniref:Glycoside hydrolase family 76 protein n=1 Tax=Baudoinia panamericana (strain UAMH 10762) TaxID=717646 RepID=M2N8X5_BAUPA|nr:glycoside hydrolase family 76 protein [Baudoinia panamericana UAMH 10762]EMC95524.1 glycoside hydrolase family 76 protein [Baudoinia panamericana UAMH 10762]